MKKISFIILLLTSFLIACKKQANISGTVYSQSNIPIAGVTVKLDIYLTQSSYPTHVEECLTDANGNYYFSEKVRKKASFDIECRCDSGYANGGKWGVLNGQRIDLHLKK
jgi:hypothetical protein